MALGPKRVGVSRAAAIAVVIIVTFPGGSVRAATADAADQPDARVALGAGPSPGLSANPASGAPGGGTPLPDRSPAGTADAGHAEGPARFVVVLDDRIAPETVADTAREIVARTRRDLPSLRLRGRDAPRDLSEAPAAGVIFRRALRGFAVELSAEDAASIDVLRRERGVRYVAADLPVELHAQMFQPGMERIRAGSGGGPTPLNAFGSGGVDVDVAILDTGIDTTHPDLVVHRSVTFVPGDPSLGDGHGHGTHVAGLAAAIDDDNGIRGVAPGARLWSVKIADQNGLGDLSAVLSGLDYVLENADEIDVVNMSIGFTSLGDDGSCGSTIGDALHEAVCAVVDAGVVVVVSAGNAQPYGRDASQVSPASFDEVITVSAVVETDGLGPGSGQGLPTMYGADNSFAGTFSNYGWDVDIAAPGAEIMSTAPGGGYVSRTGTSAAAPHVAGAAALWIALNGKPADRDGVLHVRDELVRLAFPQSGPDEGFTDDKDTFAEPLLNVAAIDRSSFDPIEPTMRTDKPVYIYGDDATAVATVHVVDAAGLPVPGIHGNGFRSWLAGRQHDAGFRELGGGDYSLTLDISGLLPGDHELMVVVTSAAGDTRSAGCRVVIRDDEPRIVLHGFRFAWPVVSPAWLLASNPLTVYLMDEKGAPLNVPTSAFQTSFSGGGPQLAWAFPPQDFTTGVSPGITYGAYRTAVTNVQSLATGTYDADLTVTDGGLSASASTSFEVAYRDPALDASLTRNLARFDYTQAILPPDLDLRVVVTNEWETGVSGLTFLVTQPFVVLIDGEELAGASFAEESVQSGIYVARNLPIDQLTHGLHDLVVRVTDSRGLVTHSNPVSIDVFRGFGACGDPTAAPGEADADGDGIRDRCDNCPDVPNPSQNSTGAGGGSSRRGDACLDRARLWVSSDPADRADYATIQEAVDQVVPGSDGALIEVLPGLGPYVEAVLIDRGESIGIVGSGAMAIAPVIEAPAGAIAAIDVRSAGAAPVHLQGLVLRGAGPSSGQNGVLVQADASTLITGLRFENLAHGLRLGAGSHDVRKITADATVGTGILLEDGRLGLVHAEMRGTPRALQLTGGSATATVAHLLHVGDGTGTGVLNQSLASGALDLRHSTLVDGGIAVSGIGGNTTIAHSILWSNQSGIVGIPCTAVTWSDLQDTDCGGTNLSIDPLFVAPLAGDFRLQPVSPLLDHGPAPDLYDGSPCTDLDGLPRLADHDGEGLAQLDPGAFERGADTPAPPKATGLAWIDDSTLTWEAEPAAVTYHVYKSPVSELGYAAYGTCHDSFDASTTDTAFTDTGLPLPGEAFFYEVTTESAIGEESSLGTGTCAERSNYAPCS